MNAQLVRPNALIPLGSAVDDLTGKEGYPVSHDGADNTASLLFAATGVVPFGVIVQGRPTTEKSTVAVAAGGLAGTVRVKLAADVPIPGSLLKLALGDDEFAAFAPDTGSGARVVMAQALEAGAAEELIEAVLFQPKIYTS